MGMFDDILDTPVQSTTRRGSFDDILDAPFTGFGGFAGAPPAPQAPRIPRDLDVSEFGVRDFSSEFGRQDPFAIREQRAQAAMAPAPMDLNERRQKVGKLRAKYIDYRELWDFLDELEADEELDYFDLEKEFLYAVGEIKDQRKQQEQGAKLAEKAAKDEERRYEKFRKEQQKLDEKVFLSQRQEAEKQEKKTIDAEKFGIQQQTKLTAEQIKAGAQTPAKTAPKSAFLPWEQERMAQEFIAQDEAKQFQEKLERETAGITDPAQAQIVADNVVKIESLREALPRLPAGQQMQAKALLAKMIARKTQAQMLETNQDVLFWQNATGATKAAGRTMRETALPTTVGALTGFGASKAVASRHPAVGIVLGLGAGIAGALGAAKVQEKVQKSVLGEEDFARYQQKLAEDRQKYPTAVFAGEQLPSLLVGKVNAKELKSAVGAAKAIITGRNAKGLSNEQIVSLYNAAFGGTLGAGQEVARGLKEGDIKWTEVAAAAILNSVINDTRFGAPVKAKADTLSITPDAKVDLDKEAIKALDAFAGSIRDTEAAAPVTPPARPTVEPTTTPTPREATRQVEEEIARMAAEPAPARLVPEVTSVRVREATYNFRDGEWYREGSTVPVKATRLLDDIEKEVANAVQIRETETLPMGEGAGNRPPVDREVREQAPAVEGKVPEAEVGGVVTQKDGSERIIVKIRPDGSPQYKTTKTSKWTDDYGKTYNEGYKAGDVVSVDDKGNLRGVSVAAWEKDANVTKADSDAGNTEFVVETLLGGDKVTIRERLKSTAQPPTPEAEVTSPTYNNLSSTDQQAVRQAVESKLKRGTPGQKVKIYRGLAPSETRDISAATIGPGDYVAKDFDKAATYAGRKNRFATGERGQIPGRVMEMEVDAGDLIDMGKGNFVYAPKGFDVVQIRGGAANRPGGLGDTLGEIEARKLLEKQTTASAKAPDVTDTTARDVETAFRGLAGGVSEAGQARVNELVKKQGYIEYANKGAADLFRKQNPDWTETIVDGKSRFSPPPTTPEAPRPPVEEGVPAAAETETPGYKAARDPLVARATELGIDTKGTNAELQARITKREKVLSFIDDVERGAKERLAELQKTTTLGANKPLGMATEYVILGAAKMARGTIKFADWSRAMVDEFGDAIRPYLRQIYQRAITINRKDFGSPEEFQAFSEKIANGFKLETKDVDLVTSPKTEPPPGMAERQTVTRAGEGRLKTEAEALRESGEAFREIVPIKSIAESAAKNAEVDSAGTWNDIKAESDAKVRAAKIAGYISSRADKGADLTSELDELAKMGTEAGTILRAVREANLGTPQGRANIAVQGFLKFAERKGQTIDKAILDRIKRKFVAAENLTDDAARTKAYFDAVDFAVSNIKLKFWDVIDAYRYTNALSSPQTHERNIAGNLFNVAISRPLSLIGQGEIKNVARFVGGAAKSIGEASKNFKNAFSDANLPVRSTDDMTSASATDDFGKSYQRKVPKVLQYIPRFLEAQDQFFSTLIRGGEMQRLLANGTNPILAKEQADKLAENFLYRDRIGETERDKSANAFSRAIDSIGSTAQHIKSRPTALGKLADIMIMFVRTPVKIAERGFEFSPLGYVAPGLRKKGGKIWQRDWGFTDEGIARGKYGKSFSKLTDDQKADVVFWKKERLGRANAGTAVMALGGLMAMEDRTTWAEPTDKEEKAAFYESGKKPYSIKIGDKWVPYISFGPLALAFAIPAAVKDWAANNPNRVTQGIVERIGNMTLGLAKYYMSQTPTDSVANFFQTINGKTDLNLTKLPETLGFAASQFIPLSSLQRYVNKWIDGEFKETDGFWDEIKQNVVGQSRNLVSYTTMEGLPAKRTAWDLLPPFSIGIAKDESALVARRKELEAKNLAYKKADEMIKDYKAGKITIDEIMVFFSGLNEEIRPLVRSRLRMADPEIKAAFEQMNAGRGGPSFGPRAPSFRPPTGP